MSPNDAVHSLREWWASPPRSGACRWLAPWEYRHLRLFGIIRLITGAAVLAAGLICLSHNAYGWAAFFLTLAALNVAGGRWELSIAKTTPGRGHR
jgi:hypothetical protein